MSNGNRLRKLAERMPWLTVVAATGSLALYGCGSETAKKSNETVAGSGPVPSATNPSSHHVTSTTPATTTRESISAPATSSTTHESAGAPNLGISPTFIVKPGETPASASDRAPQVTIDLRLHNISLDTWNRAVSAGTESLSVDGKPVDPNQPAPSLEVVQAEPGAGN